MRNEATESEDTEERGSEYDVPVKPTLATEEDRESGGARLYSTSAYTYLGRAAGRLGLTGNMSQRQVSPQAG